MKSKLQVIQGLRLPGHGHDTRPWEEILGFFVSLSDQNDAFIPLLQLTQKLIASPYPAVGLYGLTSMHDILIGRSTDIVANPHLRISYNFEKKQFTLTYQDFTKQPWTRSCTTEEIWSVLERFLVKRARWFREVDSFPNRSNV